MNDSEQAFNVRFVLEVKKYPCLYNNEIPQYSRKDITEEAWNNVGRAVGLEGTVCKEKWKNLKTVYMRYRRKSTTKRPYYLTEAISFLAPYIKDLPPLLRKYPNENGFQEEYEDSIADFEFNKSPYISTIKEEVTQQPPSTSACDDSTLPLAEDVLRPTVAKRRKINENDLDRAFIQLCDAQMRAGEDTDHRKMFLLSLLDEVNEMTNEQMKVFKRKVLGLIDSIMSS